MFNASQRGFQVTFPNGWTASIMFGKTNYCDNNYKTDSGSSTTAEFWAWNTLEQVYPKDPIGFQKPADVPAFLAKVSTLS